MPERTSEDLLALLDGAPLNRRYWVTFALMAGIAILDFFDFLIVGYILAVVGPRWHLTYGQSALILYSGGLGAILGGLSFGGLSDAWGRKPAIVAGTLICGISAAMNGLVPHGAWWLIAILRFWVGIGLTAATAPALTVIVELTPLRHRTRLTSLYQLAPSAGGLVASSTSATLLAALGWRGMMMLGIAPAFLGVLVWLFIPESARWLTAKGRFSEARANVAQYLAIPLQSVPLPIKQPSRLPRGNLRDLYSEPRRFWETWIIWGGSATAAYGIYLWGPTIVAMVLAVPVQQAAKYFVFVALAGIIGKLTASFLVPVIGRRRLGAVWGFGGVIALVCAGYFHSYLIGGLPLLVVLLCCSTFCVDGGFANLPPYTVERYGVRLGARSAGLGQGANGVGKILGPLSLALIAGTSNIVKPHATVAAVFPAYLFLAGCMLLVGLSFVIFGVETHGRTIALDTEDETTLSPVGSRREVGRKG